MRRTTTQTLALRITGAFTVLAAMAALMLFPLVRAASYKTSIQAHGMDTIAGYESLLSVSHAEPHSAVTISVGKPDGGTVKIPVTVNGNGGAQLSLYDYHTRKSGQYSVMAYPSSGQSQGSKSSFTVYADSLSLRHSELVAQSGIAKADGSAVSVRATLKDQYGNGVQGRQVNLISSRSGDVIKNSGHSMTDSNGTASFLVSSNSPGVSVFTAIDAASGDVLESRAQVAFLGGDAYLADAGGDFFAIPKAAAQSAGPLHHFAISGLPSSVGANQNVSFRVTAQDQNDITVENYTGTVRFSASGSNSENATLPEDYVFKAEDLGTHEFSLGLKFPTSGTYTLSVRDTSNTLIAGETAVIVGAGSGSSGSGSGSGSTDQKPSIITPVSGTYSQNVQTVSGSAPTGTTVRIYDNDQEIGSVQIGSNGSYSYQTAPLTDGAHSLYVTTSDSQGTVLQTSETVEVEIDTTPPTVDEVTIEPMSGIKTGDIMTVRVLSEADLSEAALVFNAEIFELAPSLDQVGMYTATLQAPANPGEYPLDVLLVDALGNEATYQDEALITITADGTGSVSQGEGEETPEETPVETPEETPEEVPEGNAPSQVFGVIAFGSNERVTLIWEAATDDGTIDHYKIYYGTDPLNLSDVVETNDAATTWYVPGLENGKEYYFAVAAIDNDGFESVDKSELVNAIPFTLEVEAEVPERPDTELGAVVTEPVLRGAAQDQIPPEMVENGPEILWLLLGSGAASGFAGGLSRRKKKVRS